MSVIQTMDASSIGWRVGLKNERAGAFAATPAWLRPTAAAFILGLHAAALITPRSAPVPTPLDAIEVSMVSDGESVSQAASAASAEMDVPPDGAPPERETAPPVALPPPQVADMTPPVTAPPPVQMAPDPVTVPLDPPKPIAPPLPEPVKIVKPLDPAVEPPKRERLTEDEDRKKRDEKRRKLHQQAAAAAAAAKAKAGASALKAGVRGGSAAATGMSIASYGALVLSQIQAHKFFPPGARAQGVTGSVGVQFSVSASGHVGRASVIRSSGNGSLDAAARQIVMSIHAPPPPAGTFEGSTSINFGI